jgi:hypothetical protein
MIWPGADLTCCLYLSFQGLSKVFWKFKIWPPAHFDGYFGMDGWRYCQKFLRNPNLNEITVLIVIIFRYDNKRHTSVAVHKHNTLLTHVCYYPSIHSIHKHNLQAVLCSYIDSDTRHSQHAFWQKSSSDTLSVLRKKITWSLVIY